MNCDAVSKGIQNWLLGQLANSRQVGFVIGVSGGIDSAVVSTLCARTGKLTLAISMPIHQEARQLGRASRHLQWLSHRFGTMAIEVDLTDTFDTCMEDFERLKLPGQDRFVSIETILFQGAKTELGAANTRSRLRMMALYYYANSLNYLVAGTGNLIEDRALGFFTKYGDGGVDISPIGNYNKTEVFELGRYLGVSEEILSAKPTDGLWGDNRSDEDQIGDSYADLEIAMEICDKLHINSIAEYDNFKASVIGDTLSNLQIKEKTLLNYLVRHETTKHKMSMPPICPRINET